MSDWPGLFRSDALGAAAAACRIFADGDEELDVVRQAEASFIGRSLTYLWIHVLDDRQREDIREILAEHDLDLDNALAAAEDRTWLGIATDADWGDLLRFLADDAADRTGR